MYVCSPARPYFERKAKLNQVLDDQKRQVELIEETIAMTKCGYADSLRQLERISEEIHERRLLRAQLMHQRGLADGHEKDNNATIKETGSGGAINYALAQQLKLDLSIC